MSNTRIARYRLGLEKCMQQATSSSNSETEIWLSLADGYRWLLEREQRELDRDRWEHIVADVITPKLR
jgi:hypothetical protein